MSIMQDVMLKAAIVLEDEEIATFQETRVVTNAMINRGIVLQAEGGHFVPQEASWTGELIDVTLEDSVTLYGEVPESEEEEAAMRERELLEAVNNEEEEEEV